MNPRRALAVTRRLVLGVRHEPRELALVCGAPVVAVVVMGVLFLGREAYRAQWVFLDQFLPGVVGIVGFFLPALIAALSVFREKRDGTLDRLLTTPMRPGEVVGGHAAYYGAVSLFPAAALTGLALSASPGASALRVVLVFLSLELLAHSGAGLGFLLSMVRVPSRMVRGLPLAMLPVFLLSGALWPVAAMPVWLRPLSLLTPPYHALEACRSLLPRGLGAPRIWPALVWLAGIGSSIWIAAALGLRRSRA